MQDGAQLSLQGSLVVSMNGVSGSVVGDGASGTTALYVLMGVIGGAVGIGGAYYLVKKIYFPRSSPNSYTCLLYTSPSPRDQRGSRMPSSA